MGYYKDEILLKAMNLAYTEARKKSKKTQEAIADNLKQNGKNMLNTGKMETKITNWTICTVQRYVVNECGMKKSEFFKRVEEIEEQLRSNSN